jgi:hypothetical protein
MQSRCKIDCELHSIFESEHVKLERLDRLEVTYLRLRANLPIANFAAQDFLMARVMKLRRMEKIISRRIDKITRILNFGPGCSKCMDGGEVF